MGAKESIVTWLAATTLVVLAANASRPLNAPTKPRPPTTLDDKLKADAQVVMALRSAMKHPKSFQLEEALRMSDGTLCLKYRATNDFNASVPGQAVINAEVARLNGDPGFDTAWTMYCNSKLSDDITFIRRGI